MTWREILIKYKEMFGESIGVPWDGFANEKVEEEYWQILETCIKTNVSISKVQRDKFFIEEIPGVVY